MILRGRSRLIVIESLSRCMEPVIGAKGNVFEVRVPSHTLVRMSALTKGILVAAGAICVAFLIFATKLDSTANAPTEPAGSGAASSGPVAFPNSGSRRTKAIWQDPLGASLIVAGVLVGGGIVARGRRSQREAAD